mmetsp:Transcript_38307/g.89664  ORF Transcript_38307/g.89664 Transcript_38307/m.89664 type:complete len:321 (-) Transcript_38307:137-1099(-)|eukprot:CAMPEP_0119361264 /NCGR_PEP_ID=MMETSP1334-20130426/8609_1 /TAXON_ID=127549 /ORGANISM="Calcidiscus leptoporus, Strain RCC1130" /LENGTH=320 /DNA_ID=CAMNT_0007376231 /DNA_START=1168 /DNA_END=2130 /DNA_ORIENTATION=+
MERLWPQGLAIVEGTREILADRREDLTAKDVRIALERRLGLPEDGLLSRREEVAAAIKTVMQENSATPVQTEAVEHMLHMLLTDGETAQRMLASANETDIATLVLLADTAAASESAARVLAAAHLGSSLVPMLQPGAPRQSAAAALQLLSGATKHAAPDISKLLLLDDILQPLLSLFALRAEEELAVRVAMLLNSLADSRGSRFRLLHGGALRALTHTIIEPMSSGALKEHCLQAVASIAGRPDDEVSLPQILGLLCADRLPGTQREALASLQIIAEKQPELCARLLQVDEIAHGLASAVESSDTTVSVDAADLLKLLKS